MNPTPNKSLKDDSGLEHSFADYLRSHPEFFERHPELLVNLRLPHQPGGAVSLVERQTKLLREQVHEYKHKLAELVEVARDNDRLNLRMHRLSLALIEADSLEHCLRALDDVLRNEFEGEMVRVRLYAELLPAGNSREGLGFARDDLALESFGSFFKVRRPLCGQLAKEQLRFLFTNEAEQVASAVVMPLVGHADFGMLAIGSRDAERFHSGLGKVFLTHMGELVSAALARFLPR